MYVPTMAMRSGDFSGLINSAGVLQQLYDPNSTQSAGKQVRPPPVFQQPDSVDAHQPAGENAPRRHAAADIGGQSDGQLQFDRAEPHDPDRTELYRSTGPRLQ